MAKIAFLSLLLVTCGVILASAETDSRSFARVGRRFRRAIRPGVCGLTAVRPRAADFHRIVGGQDAVPHSYPFLISFQTFAGVHYCGGSLLRTGNVEESKIVVSAAHCFNNGYENRFAVAAVHAQDGYETGHQISRIKKVIIHESYSKATFDNDIALVILDKPIKFNDNVYPVCLPQQGEQLATNTALVVAGWGDMTEGTKKGSVALQQVTLPTVDTNVCKSVMNPLGWKINLSTMICAGKQSGGQDSCQGDSGGPLFSGNGANQAFTLRGIVSFGSGCARPNTFGVYTMTSTYVNWINNQIQNNRA